MSIGGLGLVMIAAVLWGLSGGLGGFLMDRGWDPLVIAFYRGAVGLIFIGIWLILRPVKWSRKMLLWSLVAGLGVAGNFIFYFVSISEGSIAVAATLMYTAPIFVLLTSFILRLEKPTVFKWLAILSVTVGVVLMTEVYAAGSDGITPFGIATGLGAGLSYALFLFSFKRASLHGKPQGVLTVAFLTLSVLMLFVVDYGETVSAVTSPDLFWMILLGIFGAGLSFFLYITGLKKTTPTAASVSAMVEPVTASLFGVLVMGEGLTLPQLGGMGIILGTVTILSVKNS
ncbi:DMT family transporter [Alkalibacterium pelagium]|uniref:Threonine/homoserine efflux transporter RhtA n=1 Tax=Alkalibacterium pelagium TaxID=426702 RepID=A0A1H7KJ04_9LACT|nr:EamA family transporter [Alkalibacterium pelagium]GEN50753.1 transporter [Alkalibacterium pelagium]SEK85907.1 Threonine/homoserine efflux transporter RhtA [Alkalibacterium pelagium]